MLMKPTKFIVIFLLLFVVCSTFGQRVHYKDNYYTLVNSKIFHLGHNVYGSLTAGARDTIYMIARELYNDKGKMKPHYKARRKRDRYKLPEGFWEQKNAKTTENIKKATPVVAIAEAATLNKNKDDEAFAKAEPNKKAENLHEETESSVKDTEQVKEKALIEQQSKQKEQKTKAKKAVAQIENSKKEEQIQQEKDKRLKREKEQKRKEEKFAKAEKKEERKEKKAEKKEKKKEKELKQKEKALDKFEDAEKKLKKTEKKYKKLKEKGELSPNDETEWLEKIEKLKEKIEKTKKKAKKA